MAHRASSIALIAWLVAALPVAAQPQHGQRSDVTAGGAGQTSRAVINGSVLDQDSRPLPDARVRLRNLRTSHVEQNSVTNRKGEFRFVADPDTPYVVELTDTEGRIVSISDVITLQKAEVSGTVLSARASTSVAQFFGVSAGTLATALSGLGITSIQEAPPLSPEK